MKTILQEDLVQVEAPPLELMKFATRLRKELGGQVRQISSKCVAFPADSLGRVSHLFSDEHGHDPQLSTRIADHQQHCLARAAFQERLTENPNLPEPWDAILEPAQASAVYAMITPRIRGLCLFDEQGSGKTVMTIAAFDILKRENRIDVMVVVCPKSMLREWPTDTGRFCAGFSVVVAEGKSEERFNAALENFDILVTNYEGVAAIRRAIAATARTKRVLLAVDESYMVKNTESLRSTELRALRSACRKCFVLCGTPAPNSPYDLVNQFDLADEGFTFGGFERTNNEAQDRERIEDLVETRGTFIRRLKTEILANVPEKRFRLARVDMEGRQRLLYEKARDQLVLDLKQLDNSRFRKNLGLYFQRRAVLLQICSNPAAVDPTYAETPAKYVELDRLISELTSSDRKAVIWSFYTKGIDDLMTRYAAHRPVRIDGSVSTDERTKAVQLFQEDPSRLLFIGNPSAAGAGITLHAAANAIYVSYSNQAAHYLQSLDRIHRRGQESPTVDYHLLYCGGTIEETEIARLRRKEVQQHSLLGDKIYWPSSLDDALAELSAHT